jgi:aspartokinase-like uncharacterized kinase
MQSLVPLRIIKLGGSLLSLDDLRPRFHAWLQTQTPARNLIVAGGGQAVEAIRELDAIHHFSAALAHWICIDLMSVTATLASELLDLERPIATERGLSEFLTRTSASPAIACIRPTAYYTPLIAASKQCTLPESWDCTSDSIAAWLAISLAADQLVLLKSIDSGLGQKISLTPTAIQALADRHAVDPVFPKASQHLKDVRIINLRVV